MKVQIGHQGSLTFLLPTIRVWLEYKGNTKRIGLFSIDFIWLKWSIDIIIKDDSVY
jgi:hypothetical protein